MGDEQYFLKATNEVTSGTQEPALWAKAIAISEGDVHKAKYRYINLRVDQLAQDEKPPNSEEMKIIEEAFGTGTQSTEVLNDSELDGYLPIDEFSRKRGLDTEAVKEMTKGGLFQGKEANGHIYIKDQVGKDIDKKPPNEEPIVQGESDGENGNTSSPSSDSKMGVDNKTFWRKLLLGNYGLAKTYWGFYGLGMIVLVIISRIILTTATQTIIIIYFLSIIAYTFIMNISIWRAANAYQGLAVWRGLAKFLTIVSYVITGGVVLSIIGMLDQ